MSTSNEWLIMRAQGGDAAAVEELLRANERLVCKVAWCYFPMAGCLEVADLVQEGRIGLLRAIERFDPTAGAAFTTYAWKLAAQAILRAVQDTAEMIRRPREEPPVPVRSLSEPMGEDGDSTLGDLLPGRDEGERILARAVQPGLLEHLSDLERRVVVVQRYGLDGNGERSQAEVAQTLGFSRQYAHQVEQRAMHRLRDVAEGTTARPAAPPEWKRAARRMPSASGVGPMTPRLEKAIRALHEAGRSVGEIAARLGLPSGVVETALG